MQAQYKAGHVTRLDYTASGAVAAGDVIVVGDLPLIAPSDIAAGETDALDAGGGIYDVAKIAGAAIGGCVKLYWDDTNNGVTTTASTHKVWGYSSPDGAASAATVIRALHRPGG